MVHADILIVGGGAAGISAASAAYDAGCRSIIIADRKPSLGGVLLQCTHPGFGSGLTGIQYAGKILEGFPKDITLLPNSTVLSVSSSRIACISGGIKIFFSRLILATGCYEIPIGALSIAGTRPGNIFTAGQMQEMINLHGYVPDGPVVILGSGDMGLIMASAIAGLGIPVTIVEQKDSCGGMARNRRCLTDGNITLICGQTVTEIFGDPLLEGCRLSDGRELPCRTLLIAAGLRSDRSLVEFKDIPSWLYLCGNCSEIHSMVESVISDGKAAGVAAYTDLRGSK